MNVTIAKYLTPNDTDINKKGIQPDFDIEVTDRDTREGKGPWWLDPSMPRLKRKPEDFRDLQLKKAFEVLKQEVKVASPLAIGPH
jgi:carboxyl-terminal processing protease